MNLRVKIGILSVLLLILGSLVIAAHHASSIGEFLESVRWIVALALILAGLAVLGQLIARRATAYAAWHQQHTLRAIVAAYKGAPSTEDALTKLLDTGGERILSRSELYQLYALIKDTATLPGLAALNAFLRDQLRQTRASQLEELEKTYSPPSGQANQEELRADTQRLLCLSIEAWKAKLEGESLRAALAIANAAVTTFIAVAFFAWLGLALILDRIVPPPTVIVAAVFAGAVGGFVSIQQRLQSVSKSDAELSLESPRIAAMSILTAPVLGGTGALVVYVILSGGLLSGAMFPRFVECPPPMQATAAITGAPESAPSEEAPPSGVRSAGECAPGSTDVGGFMEYVRRDSVKARADLAKLLFWCFVAGFLERFVPDTITRLAGKSSQEG